MDFNEGLRKLSIQLVPFMMAVVFHEFAHGWVANRWGDPTAKDEGRLTLNPVPHIDPIGTLLFPIINMVAGINLLIGWAKPVPINPSRFRKYRPGLFWVSIAGVSMNFILAMFSAALYCALRVWAPDFYFSEPLQDMAISGLTINYALGIFNLIPIPPLDGSKIVESFLSYNATRKYEKLAQYSFFILIALMFTGALSILSVPIRFMAEITLYGMATLFQLGDLL